MHEILNKYPQQEHEHQVPVPDSAMHETSREKRKRARHWTLADIPWNCIDHERARTDPLIYYTVAAASFVETAADLYTANLVEHFPDPEAQQWLMNHWQPEELQHGLALRTYVETVWPELDWPYHYGKFLAEYSRLCTLENLEQSRALEMVARCVVETGTSSFYAALRQGSSEPVLANLAGLISQDEVRHYSHFRRFFQMYQKQEHIGRIGIIRSLYKRITAVENEDTYIGLKHAWLMRHPGQVFLDGQFDDLLQKLLPELTIYYPYHMLLKMLLQPLSLNRTLVKFSLPVLEQAARRLLFKRNGMGSSIH
jgi:hypothetical protein